MADNFFHDINNVPLKDGAFVLFLPDYSSLRELLYGIILDKKIVAENGILYHSTNIYEIKRKTKKEQLIYRKIHKVRNEVIKKRKNRQSIKMITQSHCKPFSFYQTASGKVFLYIGYGLVETNALFVDSLKQNKLNQYGHGHIFCCMDRCNSRLINEDTLIHKSEIKLLILNKKKFVKELPITYCHDLSKCIDNKSFVWMIRNNISLDGYITNDIEFFKFTLK